jgi:hypothetical protein
MPRPRLPELTRRQEEIIEHLLPLKTYEYIAMEADCKKSQVAKYARKYTKKQFKILMAKAEKAGQMMRREFERQ